MGNAQRQFVGLPGPAAVRSTVSNGSTSEALPGDLRSNPPILMNETELATFLNICPRSVRNFTARRLLPVIRLGRRRLYRRDAVIAALRTLENNA